MSETVLGICLVGQKYGRWCRKVLESAQNLHLGSVSGVRKAVRASSIEGKEPDSPFLSSGASQAGTPYSSTTGSGQLWATTPSAAQCCTLAPSKMYLKADNPLANHQRYLFFPSYLQARHTRSLNTYFVRNVCRAIVPSSNKMRDDICKARCLVPVIVS